MIAQFYNDNKTAKELLDNIEISLTSYNDAKDIVSILCKSFNISSVEEALKQLIFSKADLNNSVKAYDKRDGKIYGILVFSEFNINQGSPLHFINPFLSDVLNDSKQLNGHSFVIDERLRGTNLDKKMLFFQKDYLKTYDIIWCGVENDLNTHSYWQRLGFIEAFHNKEAKFYIKSFNKNIMLQILILKMLNESNEKNFYKRKTRAITV